MSSPLVLYYAGPDTMLAIDARAGAELIRERWPGAELVACGCDVDLEERLHEADWILGLDVGEWKRGASSIDPTPDASIAMQVWLGLHCCCGGDGLPPEGWSDDACGTCDQDTRPQPPAWLRYLDDAITERWELPDSREVWSVVESWDDATAAVHILIAATLTPETMERMIYEGRAILRARERWEDGCRRECGPMKSLLTDLARLRAERDDAREGLRDLGHDWCRERCYGDEHTDECERALAVLGAETRKGTSIIDRLRAERDEMQATISRICEWTHQYGAALCPPHADTYGEGMRDAKDQVSRLLAGVDHG